MGTISVEQQFYLVYPLDFAAARRLRNSLPLLALVVASLLLRVAEFTVARSAGLDGGGGGGGHIVFYWSSGQCDGFGIGALMAWHAQALRRQAMRRRVLCLAGAVVLGIVAVDVAGDASGRGVLHAAMQPFVFPTKLPLEGAMAVTTYLAVVAAAAAALATAIGPEGVARRVLRWPPLVHVGRISYGLYVWHMMVVVGLFALCGSTFATAALPLRLASLLPCVALSVAVAEISYRCWERRFHRRVAT